MRQMEFKMERQGLVKEVKETPRGFYTVVEFDEDEPT